MDKFVCKLSFWSALVIALLVVLIDVGLVWSAVVFPMTAITSIEAYQLSFTGWQMLPLLPALILAPMFVVLMLCVHEYAPSDRKILGKVSSAFAIVSASVLSIHYYTQLTIVRQGLLNNQTVGVWLFSAPNPDSFFWSFAALGYGFMGLALFVAAPIFKEKAENNIRLLFAANGAVGIGMFVGNALGIFIANILASFIWGVLFPVATLLVA
ncbi:MAG: hypothetical protein ACXV4B_03165, partial [Halobacteriota archaeon]